MAQLLELVQNEVSERVGYQVKLKHEDFIIDAHIYGFNNQVDRKVFPNVWEFEFDDWGVTELYIGNTQLNTSKEGWEQIEKLFGKDRKFFDNLIENSFDKIQQPDGRKTLADISDVEIFDGLRQILSFSKTFESGGVVFIQSYYSMYTFLKTLKDRGYITPQKYEIMRPGNSYKSSCLKYSEVEDLVYSVLKHK